MVNGFSLKRSVFNKWNSCTVICSMLLCYFTFICLVDVILTRDIQWYIVNGFVSLEQITEIKSLTTFVVQFNMSKPGRL